MSAIPEPVAPAAPRRFSLARLREWDAVAAVAVVVIALGAVQLVWGVTSVGVTIDEPTHVERLEGWLETGWYVPERLMVEGEPDPAVAQSNAYVYGPAYALLGHAANVLVGNESPGEVSTTASAYAVRHLVVALTALFAVGAVGAAAGLLSGSRRFGLWAAAALLAMPRWSGHSFFNLKDVPLASGYTLVTAALVFALFEPPGGASPRRRLAIGATLALGLLLAAGTRPGIWPALLASLLAYAALRLGQHRLGRLRRPRGTDLAVLGGAAAGALAIGLSYPNAARTPITLLAESISGSSAYPWEGVTLTAGQLLTQNPPWWYLPAWVGGTFPLLLAAAALGGLMLGIATLTVLLSGEARLWARRRLGLLLVLTQLLLVPVLAVLGGSTFYDGLRQHLYILPAAAILAGVGAALAWAWSRPRQLAWRAALTVALCLALVVPVAQQLTLFPYNYTYFNPIVRIDGIEGRWEADYWLASIDEAIARVPSDVDLLCSGRLVPPGDLTVEPDLRSCEGLQSGPYLDRRGTDLAAVEPASLRRPGVWLVGPRRTGYVPPPYCEEAGNVTRTLLGEEVTMSYVLRCDPDRLLGQ